VAEWLGRGLQSLAHRFDSGRRLSVAAQIGPQDLGFYEPPRPDLLLAATGIEPEPQGHVRLDRHTGIRSTQRLAAGGPGNVRVGFWPAELKPQAEYLYQQGRALRLLSEARARAWEVLPAPQLAFYTSPPSQRLYIEEVEITAEEYARRWEGPDGKWIVQHNADDVRRSVWPWLKSLGYVSDSDDGVLDRFLSILGRRPAHLRPALRVRREWARSHPDLADAIRSDLDAIFRAAGEPGLSG
jgi:hypothetical protein